VVTPFDTHSAWAHLHRRGRVLLNRLTAIAADVELLGESAEQHGSSGALRSAIEELRGQLSDAARESRGMLEEIAAQLPNVASADLAIALRDTLAPLRKHLARRETVLIAAEVPLDVRVAVEPELLRAAIAAVLDALLAGALPSEVLRIAYLRGERSETVSFAHETRLQTPQVTGVRAALASLAAWLEEHGGALHVERHEQSSIVALELPRSAREGAC
jgi:hypothetical protein